MIQTQPKSNFFTYLHVPNQKSKEDEPKYGNCYGKENLSGIGTCLKPLTKCTVENNIKNSLANEAMEAQTDWAN